MARDVEPIEQAISGRDYVAIQTTINMTNGLTRVPVEVTILSVSTVFFSFCHGYVVYMQFSFSWKRGTVTFYQCMSLPYMLDKYWLFYSSNWFLNHISMR